MAAACGRSTQALEGFEMAFTLLGFPAKPDEWGATTAVELGELAIYAEPSELRDLAAYLTQAAREMEAGASGFEAFSFNDARSPEDLPTNVIVAGGRK